MNSKTHAKLVWNSLMYDTEGMANVWVQNLGFKVVGVVFIGVLTEFGDGKRCERELLELIMFLYPNKK